MMGLRLTEGVPVARIEAIAGVPLRTAVDTGGLARLAAAGWLRLDHDRLVATPAGRQRLDALLRYLVC